VPFVGRTHILYTSFEKCKSYMSPVIRTVRITIGLTMVRMKRNAPASDPRSSVAL